MAHRSVRGSIERGEMVANCLKGSWRPDQPMLATSADDVPEIVPLLLACGTGGLGWWRLSRAWPGNAARLRLLKDAYRLYGLDASVQEGKITQVFMVLRSVGVDPILIKGLASARHYAGAGLRPFGDIDLCVRPDQFNIAWDALLQANQLRGVDLHPGAPDLPDRSWEQVVARAQLVRLGRGEIRILGPEDHLRLLCTHMIRHGAWRALWLCDVAAALEGRARDFDWDYCLQGDQRLSGWVVWALGLARRLLDARIGEPDVEAEADRVPAWVSRCVLWRWGAGSRPPLLHYWRHPMEALSGLYYFGLNPIKATFRLGFRPRSPVLAALCQLGAFAARSRAYAYSRVRQLPRPRVLFPCQPVTRLQVPATERRARE